VPKCSEPRPSGAVSSPARVSPEVAVINRIFWSIAAIEALFFVIAFVYTANERGQNTDGGKGMALIFQIALPFLILGVVSLLYWKTSSPTLHIILLIAAIIPAVVLAGQWIRGPLMDRDIAVGGYLYKDPAMSKFVAAVANLDVSKIRQLAPGIDINMPGENGVTPLKFAIEKTTNDATPSRLDMIRLLLALGAKPDPALPNACATSPETARILLDAGANPNYKDAEGDPAFFSCLSSSSGLEALRLLAQKGADFNMLDGKGESVLIRAATFSQWNVMLFFLEQGVKDVATPRGKTAASMVAQALVDDKQNSRETSPALAQLAAKLQSK
jgi:hypothetical protein